MEWRIETEISEHRTLEVRVRVIVNGQIVGPSVRCAPEVFEPFRHELQDLIRNVSDRAYAKGQHDAKTAMRAAIGALG
jgi:DNA-binding protein YbaB